MRRGIGKRVFLKKMSESSAALDPLVATATTLAPVTGPEQAADVARSSATLASVAEVSEVARPDRLSRIAVLAAATLTLGGFILSAWRHHEASGVAELPQPAEAVVQTPRLDSQIASLENQVKTDPEDAEGWRKLGWSYFQTTRYDDAARALRRSTALDPESAETYAFLGEALFRADKDARRMPRSARRAFEKALQLDPENVKARYFRAVAMDLDGRHRAAISAWFALMSDTAADAPYAADIRQAILDTAKRRDIDITKRLAATKFAPPASGLKGVGPARKNPRAPTEADMRAASLLPKGQQEAAVRKMVQDLEARLKTDPQYTPDWVMLMRTRMQLGERTKATKTLERSLAAFRNEGPNAERLRQSATQLGVPEPVEPQPLKK